MEEKSTENNLWDQRVYPMMMELANYDVECKVGLTGFKWIAKMIKDFPELEFIGGGKKASDLW
jgi:hypothetical protein